MSAKMDRIVKSMTNVLKTADRSPTPYDTQAEVVRVDGDTAWVHIAGGVDETPVKMTINAKAGDTVQVRVAGGDAWLTGNGTAPPTDDSRALVAQGVATEASAAASNAIKYAETARLAAAEAQEHVAEAAAAAQLASLAADNALAWLNILESQTDENTRGLMEQGISLSAFQAEIKLAVSDWANNTQLFAGDALEDYQTTEIPTLWNYPTFTDFFIWPICALTTIVDDALICGTNNYAAHVNEIALCVPYNTFYQWREAAGVYAWVQMTQAEVEALSNQYAYISVEESGVMIKAARNNQTTEMAITYDGVIPSRIYCC